MIVEARGEGPDGQPAEARWSLDATSNLGPYVPVLAPLALIRRMAGGWKPEPGAYPCSGVLTLGEFDRLFDQLGIGHCIEARPRPIPLAAAA
jgi:hypothetical protein